MIQHKIVRREMLSDRFRRLGHLFSGMTILGAAVVLIFSSCATDDLEVKPEIIPGEGIQVTAKLCFSQEAVKSQWGLGIPKIWNQINGCPKPLDEPNVAGAEVDMAEKPVDNDE